MNFRFQLADLFVGMAALGAGLAVHLGFWKPGYSNHSLWIGWYLLALSILTVLACVAKKETRGAYQATAAFGWTYLLFALRAGFGVALLTDAEWYARNLQIGLAMMGVCLLVAWRLFLPRE